MQSETERRRLCYCENYGIYEVFHERGNVITYYSYYGNEGFYKVTVNVLTGEEKRKHLRYKRVPKFLLTCECEMMWYELDFFGIPRIEKEEDDDEW